MAKWKLFSKNKNEDNKETTKKEEVVEIEIESEETEEENKVIQEECEEPEEAKTLAEYKETIYSSEENINETEEKNRASDQHIWRNVDKIEENIDNLHLKKTSAEIDNLDKKVDGIIEKTKKKHRKPSNVIYVVSKPQPGEVRGDWAVRSHGKIFSHHKTKEKAIEEARKIAKKRDATVMIQNTDGTFSDGFKPRK